MIINKITNLNCIAIIIARAGSKRIKNKNVKPFNNKPIISYAINSAIKSRIFDKIIVSTDSKIIKKLAEKFGAEVPFIRPKVLSNSKATTLETIEHGLKFYLKQKINFKFCCCIYPATPFLESKHLINAFKTLKNKNTNYVFAASEIDHSIDRIFQIRKNYIHEAFNDAQKKKLVNKKFYKDIGQFYFGRTKNFLKKENIMNNNSTPIIFKKTEVIDINTNEDWVFSEIIKKTKILKGSKK
jgi:pseudaminic acid cytidylyltransferase